MKYHNYPISCHVAESIQERAGKLQVRERYFQKCIFINLFINDTILITQARCIHVVLRGKNS